MCAGARRGRLTVHAAHLHRLSSSFLAIQLMDTSLSRNELFAALFRVSPTRATVSSAADAGVEVREELIDGCARSE